MAASLTHLVAGFLVVAPVFRAIERRWPSIRTQRIFRDGFSTDLGYWVFTPLITRAISRFGVVAAVVVVGAAHGVPAERTTLLQYVTTPRGWVGTLPPWGQVIALLAAGDFIAYWVHRAFHRGRLWRFHAVHHASRELDWLSSVRLHPVNDVTARMIQVAFLMTLGFPAGLLAAYVPFLTFYAVLLHANVSWNFGPFRYVLASPTFHRWHHTSELEGLDRNYAGMFPIFDLAFGTFYMPPGREPADFGIRGESVPDGLLAQMVYPFRG